MPQRHFKDRGLHLGAFSTEFIVECPRCYASARVTEPWNSDHRHWMPASLVCTACGYSRQANASAHCDRCPLPKGTDWTGPVKIYAKARCRECGRWLELQRKEKHRPKHPLTLTCEHCGVATYASSHSVYRVFGDLADPCFGLPLRLQTPCAGHMLWAYNPKHLAYLKEFLAAEIRERGPYTGSVVARLPRWLKAAKHRDEALRAVGRLERLLLE